MTSFPAKFCHLDEDGNPVPHNYGNVFFVQPCGNTQRLVIGPSTGQVRMLERLAALFDPQPIHLLYVLMLSHSGNAPGRYQSPPLQTLAELNDFLETFSEFLETDGRHHLWISNGADLLVYDQHNVIFAYGSLAKFQAVLEAERYTNSPFWFPAPHTHAFSPANADLETRLLACLPWQRSELQPGDEWD